MTDKHTGRQLTEAEYLAQPARDITSAENRRLFAGFGAKTMTEHTPIPWTIGPSSNPGNGTAWRDILSTGDVFAPSYVGEALERDADFIVRAVNTHALMLDALRAVIDDMEACGWHDNHDRFYSEPLQMGMGGAFAQVREAIRAAEGNTENG